MSHIFVFPTKNKKDINSTLTLLFLCITYCHVKQHICFFQKGYTTSIFKKVNNLKKVNNINKMGNQNTIHFQSLKELPTPLSRFQCVLHKHELLICGSVYRRACYSYHTIKNEYKFICEYPSDVDLVGHCVVKLIDSNSNKDKDNNQITLLSFGGTEYTRHTLVMKYVS
ncbi:hypothetical protein RFI_02255, partial [Reticulomyxa filosa]